MTKGERNKFKDNFENARRYIKVGWSTKTKHEKKEWQTCDRCGADIKKIPYAAGQRHFFHRSIFNPTELKLLTADGRGYISDTQLISPEIASVEITEGYFENRKTIHLCGKCRKAFEKFMRNETEARK